MTTILENEKRLLAEIIEKRLIGSKNSISYAELIEQKIPTFLRNYLQNYVRKLVYTEEPVQFRDSKRFDFEHVKIQQLRKALLEALEQVAILTRDELKEAILKTVRLQFDLLVRPRATLIKIFYSNKSDQKKSEMLPILDGLKDGRVFLRRLLQKVQQFDQFHLVETDFDRLMIQTENEIYREEFLEAFISDVRSFIDFLNMTQDTASQTIKIELVKLLLAERNLHQYQRVFDEFKEDSIGLEKLEQILKSFIVEKKHNKKVNEERNEFGIDVYSEKELKIEGAKFVDNQVQIGQKSSYEAQESTFSITEKVVNGKTICDSDPSNFIIDRSKIEEQPDVPLEPMEKIIDEKSRKLLLKKVFDQDCEAYEKFIQKINSIDNWKQAKFVIDRELNRRHVRPYSKEALRLGDLAFVRYFPEKKM